MIRCGIGLLLLAPLTTPAWGQGSSTVVISQLYGGGGNTGSTLRYDFIELFNRGTSAVNVTGWSVQYASASGNSWDRTLLSGTIGPGQFYLIQEALGTGGSVSLPSVDAVGRINLSATSGKIALVGNSTVLTTSAPTGSAIIDLVGYGGASFSEGKPTDALTGTTAAIRRSNGCTDTNNNQADFSIGAPTPRNSRSPGHLCSISPEPPMLPQVSGLMNAASRVAGVVAPGEIVTISGSNFGPPARVSMELTSDGQYATTSLASTRVLFDGVPAPLLYAVANEVGTAAPFWIVGRSSAAVQIEYNGLLSNAVIVPVAASAPGIFTVNSSGQASANNEDATANSELTPATKGSVVTISATGGGQTLPDGDDGRIIGKDIPKLRLPVRVLIGGLESEVVDASAVPGMISGMIQIKAIVPNDVALGGLASLAIIVGDTSSQSGVTIAIAGPGIPEGTGPLVDEKFRQLKTDPTLLPLSEIPSDKVSIPDGWMALVSWNTQVGGTATAPDAQRPAMVQAALSRLFGGTYQILAAQEVPSNDSANLLQTLMPEGYAAWHGSFFDTTDNMDNGLWYRNGITLRDSFPLFVTDQKDAEGRIIVDDSRALHPPQVAQFEVGDFDFTLITVHLTFADGDTAESQRELRGILDYLDWYFKQPDHDPDVIVCGDFNIPSALSGQTGRGSITLDGVFDKDDRFQMGERRFVVTVHEPTSRSSAGTGALPVSNDDHCVFSANTMKELIQARRVSTEILTDDADDPEERLTSDHFPIVVFLKIRGEGVRLDRKTRIRP